MEYVYCWTLLEVMSNCCTETSFGMLLVLLFCILSSAQETKTTNEPYATLDPNLKQILMTQFLPSDYVLPQNVYEWNVTEIVHLINDKNPDILYSIQTPLLFSVFPDDFIKQLPRDILIAHKLYYYLPIDDPLYCFNTTNCTAEMKKPITPCFGPFVKTKYQSAFVFPNGTDSIQCGLRCENTQILWNVDDAQLQLMDTFFLICGTVFLCMCIIICINIRNDLKSEQKACCQREFLFHAPLCIVFGYIIIAFCFLLPLVIGKETITCAEDLDGVQTFGSYNPGGNQLCTIMGILFYGANIIVGGYTALFSISLWRVFYAPLTSIWKELKTKTYCKCCCHIIQTLSPLVPRCKCDYTYDCRPKRSRCCMVFCSTKAWKHYIIYATAIIYIHMGYSYKRIQSAPMIGICSIGARDSRQNMIYNIIPQSIHLIISTLFLPCAIALLIRLSTHHGSGKLTFLKWKLLVYFLCIELAWCGSVLMLTFIFEINRGKLEHALAQRTQCMITSSMDATGEEGENYDECMFGYTYPYWLYILVSFLQPIAGLGSLMLSCNQRTCASWSWWWTPTARDRAKLHMDSNLKEKLLELEAMNDDTDQFDVEYTN
eukprot:845904_1